MRDYENKTRTEEEEEDDDDIVVRDVIKLASRGLLGVTLDFSNTIGWLFSCNFSSFFPKNSVQPFVDVSEDD